MGSGPGVGRDTNLRRLGQFEPNARRGKKKKKKEKPCNCDHKPFHPQYCTGFGKPYGADRVGVIKQIPLFTEVCLGPALLLQAAFWCLHTHTQGHVWSEMLTGLLLMRWEGKLDNIR